MLKFAFTNPAGAECPAGAEAAKSGPRTGEIAWDPGARNVFSL